LILNPWYKGRSLVWDAKVVDTFAESHYILNAAIPGSVATDAETNKCQKYNDILNNYYFQPVAIKTTCVYGKATAQFLSCFTKKLADISGDGREREQHWLHQHLSMVTGKPDSILACLVWKFDLVLAILSVLNNVPARHLPLFNEYLLPSNCLRIP